MLRILCEFVFTLGVTPRDVKRMLPLALRNAARRPYRMADAQEFEILFAASDLFAAWYDHVGLVDDMGKPRPLPMKGPVSLGGLFARFMPNNAPEEVVKLLVSEGLLARLPNGLYRPVRRTLIISRLNDITMDRMTVVLRGLLGTLAWNMKHRAGRQARLERQVHSTRLPVARIPEFEAMVRQAGALLIGQVDTWMSAYQAQGTSPGPTARAGVSVFSYLEPGLRPRSLRNPAKRSAQR